MRKGLVKRRLKCGLYTSQCKSFLYEKIYERIENIFGIFRISSFTSSLAFYRVKICEYEPSRRMCGLYTSQC